MNDPLEVLTRLLHPQQQPEPAPVDPIARYEEYARSNDKELSWRARNFLRARAERAAFNKAYFAQRAEQDPDWRARGEMARDYPEWYEDQE